MKRWFGFRLANGIAMSGFACATANSTSDLKLRVSPPKIAKGCEHTSQSFERVTAKTIVDPGDERITYARGSSGGCNDPGQGSGQLDLRAGGSY